jgi:phosphatidylinositol 4-kinase
MLKDYIAKANKALTRYRDRNLDILICSGIMFPFASDRCSLLEPDMYMQYENEKNEKKYIHSNLIVRIIGDECTCFNTKKRVPYRIVVETVDIREFEAKMTEGSPPKN